MALPKLRLLRGRRAVVALAVMGGVTVGGRLLGYKFGGNAVVRCRRGHLFTMLWVPGVKLQSLDLLVARIQRCPVGNHWSLVVPVRERNLSDEERRVAREHRIYLS